MSATITQAENDEKKSVKEQIDALFAPWNRTDTPGMTVGVVKDGETIYRRGFGMASLETAVANQPKTRMRIASISKHFTSLLALLLAEEGKLDIDAPIRTYVPEMSGPGGDPTLRQLMQHRGGSRCCIDLGFLAHGMAVTPIGAELAILARQTGRNFAPGEAMIYNNGGYHLLSIAIERAGGAPFEEQLKRRLFDPVGMVDTASIKSDYAITPGMATMHLPLPDGGWRRGLFPSDDKKGSGAMVSTIDDMLRWTAHLRSRHLFGTPQTWAALTERPPFPNGTVGDYGLGIMTSTYRGLTILHHSGGAIGGSSQMLTFPEHGLDIVILINGAPGAMPDELSQQIADIVLEGLLGEHIPTVPSSDYGAILGDWYSEETGILYGLSDDDGKLALSLCGSPFGILEYRPEGGVGLAPSGMGPMRVGVDDALRGDDLEISFNGASASYQRLPKDANGKAFIDAAIGTYYSHDADSTTTVRREGDGLALTFSDQYGRCEATLSSLSDRIATVDLKHALPIRAQIVLSLKDGNATGFRLDTGRTRNLLFERVG